MSYKYEINKENSTNKIVNYPERRTFSNFFRLYIFITVFCIFVLGIISSRNILLQQNETNRRIALDYVNTLENKFTDNYDFTYSIFVELLSDQRLQKELFFYLNHDIVEYWNYHLDTYNPELGHLTPRIDVWLSQVFNRSGNLQKIILLSYSDETNLSIDKKNLSYTDKQMSDFLRQQSITKDSLFKQNRNIKPFLYRNQNNESMFVLSLPVKDSEASTKHGEIVFFFSIPEISGKNSLENIGAEIKISIDQSIDLCLTNIHDTNKKQVKKSSILNNRLKITLLQKHTFTDVIMELLFVLLITVVLIALMFCAGVLLSKRFITRIDGLTKSMQIVCNGDLSTRIPIRGDEDELAFIGSVFNQMCVDLEEYIARSHIAKYKQKSAELAALNNQIQPHFLYNTLEAIRMMAVSEGSEETAKMIYLLAKLFRHQLNNAMFITLGKEMEFCLSYLELYQVRNKYGFQIQNLIPPGIASINVLKLSIQPLAENYMKHGFDPERSDNYIRFSHQLKGGSLIIRVEDNGMGISTERQQQVSNALKSGEESIEESIGLTNVLHRLKNAFGAESDLSVEKGDKVGTVVTISIPYQENNGIQIFDSYS